MSLFKHKLSTKSYLNPIVIGLFAVSLSSLGGCSFFQPYKAPITQGTIINQESMSLLQPGLTMGQVQQLLGPPMGKDPYNPRHWEYVFYTTDKDFHPQAVRHLVVDFDSDAYLKNWKVIKKPKQGS